MKKVLNLFRNFKFAMTFIFLLAICLVWFAGPIMGVSEDKRLGIIVGVLFFWVVILMIGKVVTDRAGSLLESVLRKQADDAVLGASSDQRAEITVLRSRMLGAIETLKKSNLGKSRGKAALYELPWYMIIGHPAAGKSTAIVNSGLTFPFADKGNAGIQGVGGTRNCDWFFASEGVLLDTAGRYSVEREDRPEWLEFLRLLKKYRSRTPVNGILLAVSLPEIMQASSESFVAYVRQVRERIQEIDETFNRKVPVYLIFTKLDLIGGFAQFFEDATPEERHKVWGATLEHNQGQDFDHVKKVEEEFDRLYAGLRRLGTERLALSRENVHRPGLFAFPIEFHTIRNGVLKFVQSLYEDTPYHSKPLLRGFYFTSAIQDGSSRLNTAGRIASLFNLSKSSLDVHAPQSTRSYFLRDLFRDVIFPDQNLVGQQGGYGRSQARLAGMIAGLTVFAMITGLMTWSYVGNQKLAETIQVEMQQTREAQASAEIETKLGALAKLQLRLEQLYQYRQDGAPWKLSFGLYQGAKLEQVVRAEYFRGVEDLMLSPVKASLERTLAAVPRLGQIAGQQEMPGGMKRVKYEIPPAAQPEMGSTANMGDAYNALKTYLMLHDRKRMEQSHLSDQIPRYWRPWLEQNHGRSSLIELNRSAERIVLFYISQIQEPDIPVINNNTELVGSSREVLRASMKRLSTIERSYNELKSRGNTQFSQVSVASILKSKDDNIIAGSYVIPGCFTRDAWEKYLKTAIVEASRGELKGDDWVLASSSVENLAESGDALRVQAELVALYKAEYVREWQKFLQGVVVRDFANLDAASQGLARLADPKTSPIKQILERASYETEWDRSMGLANQLHNAKTAVVDKAEKLLFDAKSATDVSAKPEEGEVSKAFSGLHLLMGNQQGGEASADFAPYLAELFKLKQQISEVASSNELGEKAKALMQATLAGNNSSFNDALKLVDGGLLRSFDANSAASVRPLLVRPLLKSYAALIPPVEEDINRAWKSDVLGQWNRMSGKYPFSSSSNEATVSEISKFLKPKDGVFFSFQEKQLGNLIMRRGDGWGARTWGDLGVNFQPGFLKAVATASNASSNIVGEDGGKSTFEMQPVPTPGLSDISVEVDGQTLRYRNGPQPWVPFDWPGTGSQGARLQVVAYSGAATIVAAFPGRLGLVRLLEKARRSPLNGGQTQMEWQVKSGTPNASDTAAKTPSTIVKLNLRVVSGASPVSYASLHDMALPERVTK